MELRDRAVRVARRLDDAGHAVFFAGGCVRDRLRGAAPKDFDLATSARPEEVQALFPRTVAVGAAFGVIVVLEEDRPFEVATFREDVGSRDGRRPESVRFADARADALRRDFTINGMFEDPFTGEVHDFVGGRADLAARVVRTIGDPARRFAEDRLRLLRAVRFATVLDFRIDPATRRAVRAAAAGIRDVSAERVRDELSRIVLSGRGGRGLGLLAETGLLEPILPEIAALDGVEQPARYHPEGDVLTHTRMLLDEYREGGLPVALAALLHDVGKAPTACINEKGRHAFPRHAPVGSEMAGTMLRRLRFPTRVVAQVQELIRMHMTWPDLPKMRAGRRRRFLMRDDFPLHLELHRLDCDASHRDLRLHGAAIEERARLEAEPPPLRPFLSGHDLVALGYTPGPAFSAILDAIVEAQLEEVVTDAESARKFVRERFEPPEGRRIAGGDLR